MLQWRSWRNLVPLPLRYWHFARAVSYRQTLALSRDRLLSTRSVKGEQPVDQRGLLGQVNDEIHRSTAVLRNAQSGPADAGVAGDLATSSSRQEA